MLKRLFTESVRKPSLHRYQSDHGLLDPKIKRSFHVSSISYNEKNLYDTLELTPNATQAQIKAAYYRLSMLHHPDKSQGQIDTDKRFQAITEAYETLSNVDKRRSYDRGIMIHSSMRGGNAEARFAGQEGIIRRKRSQNFGRTEHYNFDEFYKMHYGSTLRKRHTVKMEYEQFMREKAHKQQPLSVISAMIGVILILVSIISISPNPYDNPTTTQRDAKK